MKRKEFLKTIGLGTAAVLSMSLGSKNASRKPDKPNFIIILADDMGYNGTSVYDGWIKTPYMEKMAEEGMKFMDFHSSGVVCSPTRAGLLTGRYQERAGIPGVVTANPRSAVHYTGLQASEITFAELLKKTGYTTAIIGKWHLGYEKQYNPVNHGFDRFQGYVSGNVDYFSHYDNSRNHDWWDGLKNIKEEGYTTHLITEHSLKFIKENKRRPFCLYVAHEAVHSPFQGPNSPIQRGPDKEKKDKEKLSKDKIYVQMMTEMDKGIGKILSTVNRLGLAEKTFVLFFSDNGHAYLGPSSYKCPLHGKKGSVWEGGHRVPAIAWWPGKIKPNTVNNGMFISLDVMPTLLELAGVTLPKGHKLDGISMVPALLKGKSPGKRKLFWKGQAMRHGKWKLVLRERGLKGPGLYNLDDDLGEKNNLTAKYPERVKEMTSAIQAWKKDVEKGATKQPAPPPGINIRPKKR